jgi:hypothetical protein
MQRQLQRWGGVRGCSYGPGSCFAALTGGTSGCKLQRRVVLVALLVLQILTVWRVLRHVTVLLVRPPWSDSNSSWVNPSTAALYCCTARRLQPAAQPVYCTYSVRLL